VISNINKAVSSCEEGMQAYDSYVKKILADKVIIARILKSVVSEFEDYDEEIIKTCIGDNIEIGERPVDPGLTNSESIRGISNEDNVPNEGVRYFDVIFTAVTPNDNKQIKLIINLEAQKKMPGYTIESRGFFYCARMISSQLETEFTGSDYDSIKKVYSIWICMNVAKEDENTITKIYPIRKDVYGQSSEVRHDFFELVIIRLGSYGDGKGNELQNMLKTLFAPKLGNSEKKKILENEYKIPMNKDFSKEVDDMCNLSRVVFEEAHTEGHEKGIAEGRVEGDLERLAKLVKKNIISLDVAIEEASEYENGKELLLSMIKD